MNEGEHIGGEGETASLQHFDDALADEVGLRRGPMLVRSFSVVEADEFTRFPQRVAPLLVASGQLAQIGGNFQAVHCLQSDGRSPVMPAHRLIGELCAGFVGEVVEAISGHGRPFARSV